MTSLTNVWVVVSLIRSPACGAGPPCSTIVTISSPDVLRLAPVLARPEPNTRQLNGGFAPNFNRLAPCSFRHRAGRPSASDNAGLRSNTVGVCGPARGESTHGARLRKVGFRDQKRDERSRNGLGGVAFGRFLSIFDQIRRFRHLRACCIRGPLLA